MTYMRIVQVFHAHIKMKMCMIRQYIWLRIRQKGVFKPSDVDFVWLSAVSALPYIVTSGEQFLLLITPSTPLQLSILTRQSSPRVRVVQTFCGGWSNRGVEGHGVTSRKWDTWSKESRRGITLIVNHTSVRLAGSTQRIGASL